MSTPPDDDQFGYLYGAIHLLYLSPHSQEYQGSYVRAFERAAETAPAFGDVQAFDTISDVLAPEAPRPSRLIGRVASVELSDLFEFNDKHVVGFCFDLEDRVGRRISTPLVFPRSLVQAAEDAFQSGTQAEIIVLTTGLRQGKRQRPSLVPLAIRPLSSASAAIATRGTELRRAEALIAAHKADMLPWLVGQLRALHGVVSVGLPPEFELAELAAILQAFSTGQLKRTNPRLHMLLVGLPAAGKKLIAAIVRALQPVALPAQASTLTRAGLAAGAIRRKGSLEAQAGLLPRGHLGAVVVEDLHGLSKSHRDQVFAVLAEAMEDGTVHLSNAAEQRYRAETALYFDLNRRSDLKADGRILLGGPAAMVKDVGLPLHLLSRTDVIIEISGTGDDALRCANAMVAQEHQDQSVPARILKVVTAILRDRHPHIDLQPVAGMMQDSLTMLTESIVRKTTRDLNTAAFPRRMANSLRKLVAASARLHDRSTANESDVALAMRLLTAKADFVKRLAAAEPNLADRATRHATIRQHFGARETSPREIVEFLGTVSRRTVMRDLSEVGVSTQYGKYRIQPDRNCDNGMAPSPDDDGNCDRGTVALQDVPSEPPPAQPKESIDNESINVFSLSEEEIANLPLGDIARILPAQIAGLARDQVEALQPNQMRGFTIEQLREMGHYPFYACLTPRQARALTPAQAAVLLDELGGLDLYHQAKTLREPVADILREVAASGSR